MGGPLCRTRRLVSLTREGFAGAETVPLPAGQSQFSHWQERGRARERWGSCDTQGRSPCSQRAPLGSVHRPRQRRSCRHSERGLQPPDPTHRMGAGTALTRSPASAGTGTESNDWGRSRRMGRSQNWVESGLGAWPENWAQAENWTLRHTGTCVSCQGVFPAAGQPGSAPAGEARALRIQPRAEQARAQLRHRRSPAGSEREASAQAEL